VASGRRYQVLNATRGIALADEAEKADRFPSRGFGLMFRRSLPEKGGLIIEPCNSVVSIFMRFPIDVLFVSAEGKVLHVLRHMKPWRVSRIVRGSKCVVELPAGAIDRTATATGDTLRISQL